MALGSATHLWLLGTPSTDALRDWVLEAVPAATEADVLALRLGERTLLAAVNTSDRAWWSRSVDVVSGIKPQGVEWVFIAIYPDTGDWEVVERTGEHVGSEARAKEVVRTVVPLELKELHHYVEWAHELEEVAPGALAPSLEGVRVEALTLGLPPGPERPPEAVAAEVAGPPSQVSAAAVIGFKWIVLVPYLTLGLAGPVLAWWYLLPLMLAPPDLASLVTVLVMESAFLLPFVLVWRRLPPWARGLVIGVHLVSFAAGLLRTLG